MNMSRHMAIVLIAPLVLGGVFADPSRHGPAPATGVASGVTAKEVALRQAMRKLWTEHAVWTRQYIVAAVAGTPDAGQAAARLLKNQEDIGGAMAPYYGRRAGVKLTELLQGHILIAVDLVAAARAGDDGKLKDADRRWHDNANDIAVFLNGANPSWPKQALVEMLNQHLALTTQEAVARLGQDWEADVAAFDQILEQAMMMADTLADGLVHQFPDRF